jgi:tRNA(Ile2) C34 agmatinyltransferase TiaS
MICPNCGGRMSPLAFSEYYRCRDCGHEELDHDTAYDEGEEYE